MGWDSNRPVPWRRLVREWLIYAALMAVVFVLFFRDAGLVGAIVGLVVSGPLYLLLGWTLAKLGYSRTRLRTRRSVAAETATAAAPAASPAPRRDRPAPTRRTSTGPTQRPRRRR